jgi:trimeric autotransporter adhesin
VWTDRIAPAVAKSTAPGSWSLSDVALLGSVVFPAGSTLLLQSNTVTDSAPTYNAIDSNRVTVFSDAVVQGGDARLGTVACSNAGNAVLTATLEEMASRFPGKPCIFNPGSNADGTTGPTNESWGVTTASLGTIANGNTLPAGTGNYYNTTARLRVAFTGANNATTYYRCYERRVDASTRNCTAIGGGSYSIATVGDARVMSFSNLPLEAQSLTFSRVFVERGGAIYYGYKNRIGATSTSVRLNLPAANALLRQLQMPSVAPADAPQPLTGTKAAALR